MFLARLKNDKLINGMIAFSDSGVSVIFFSAVVWFFLACADDRAQQAVARHCSLVGYDDPLHIIKAQDYGFKAIGNLKVWLKNA
ncbi:MAG: hypothetical protein OFPI_43350 [Osedax symbiont Rs2]|nr:MAG: hypothetical protein OFPI_43350 [Osedax symbiont Rs2]